MCFYTKKGKQYYGDLNPSSVTDNKTFWKTVKPLFSSKMTSSHAIALCEQSHIFDNDQDVADIFNDFFINAVKELGVCIDEKTTYKNINNLDPVMKAIDMFKTHPSILKIKESEMEENCFCFQPIDDEEIVDVIKSLDCSKACP